MASREEGNQTEGLFPGQDEAEQDTAVGSSTEDSKGYPDMPANAACPASRHLRGRGSAAQRHLLASESEANLVFIRRSCLKTKQNKKSARIFPTLDNILHLSPLSFVSLFPSDEAKIVY